MHGLGGESLDWVDVALQLKDSFDCSALDLPGFAHSPPPPGKDLSLDSLATTVAEVARTTNRPVHLVGNSLGGAVAVRVAAEHPELVASLTLVAPALPDLRPKPGSAQLLIALLPLVGPAIVRTIIKADPEWMARRIYALCYGNPKAITPERHARELATLRQRASLDVQPLGLPRGAARNGHLLPRPRTPSAVAASGSCRRPDSCHLWRARPARVAAGCGTGETHLPGRRVAAVAEAGHVAHLEDPAAVAAAMRAFLSRPDLTRGMPERRGTVVEVGPTGTMPRP